MLAEKTTTTTRLATLNTDILCVLAFDGSELVHWAFARQLVQLGDTVLQQYYRQYRHYLADQQLAELIVGIKIVEQIRETLRWLDDEDPEQLNQYADWFRIRAKLRLVMPLMERLLETVEAAD